MRVSHECAYIEQKGTYSSTNTPSLSTVKILLSKGIEGAFLGPKLFSYDYPISYKASPNRIVFSDINADGRSDLICLKATATPTDASPLSTKYQSFKFNIQLTDISGLGTHGGIGTTSVVERTISSQTSFPMDAVAADVDGDGGADLVIYETSGNENQTWVFRSKDKSLNVSRITDSNGNTSDITYASMTSSSVYFNPPATQAVADRNEKEVMSSSG